MADKRLDQFANEFTDALGTDWLHLNRGGLDGKIPLSVAATVFPQGPQGATGNPGPQGAQGAPGEPNGSAVTNFGSASSPLIGRFQPYEQDGTIYNPQLFCRVTSDLLEYGIAAIYLSTKLIQTIALDETPPGVELAADGGGMIFNVYRYISSSLLGSVSLASTAAGLFTIKANGTDETIGYILSTVVGMTNDDYFGPQSFGYDSGAFFVNRGTLGDPDGDLSRGKEMAWEFFLDNYVSSTSLAEVGYKLLFGGEPLHSASYVGFATVGNTGGSKRFKTKIRVTYLGLTETGGGSSGYAHNFRTEVSAESWGGSPFSTNPTPLILEHQIDHEDLPLFCYFDFTANGVTDLALTNEFSQVSVHAVRYPSLIGDS